MSKNKEKNSFDKGLDKLNPNHLKFNHQELFIEILGGVNTESYSMLRVMLVVRGNRATERDHIDLYNNYQLTNFTKKVAERTGFSLKYIDEAFKALTDALEEHKQELIEKEQAIRVQKHELTDDEVKRAIEFLQMPELLERTNELIARAGVIGNEKNRLVLFLLYLSRMQASPLHAVVNSKFNYLQSKVGELVPSEQKKTIRHLSENVLFYFDENELSNKLVLVEDTGTNRGRLIPLIDFQTNGELTKLVTQKDKYGKLYAKEQVVKGPVCLSISTAKEQAFRNNAVLSFLVDEDNSTEQDERVMSYQRKQSAGLVSVYEQQSATELLQNIQRVLEPLRVVNPFAEQLVLPSELQNKQISNAHYLRFIEVLTLFKQFQREQKADELTGEILIYATAEDVKEANELLGLILLNKCDGLNTKTRLYFEKLKSYINTKEQQRFTNSDVHFALNIPLSSVKRYNSVLLSKGLIRKDEKGNRAIGFEYEIANSSEFSQLQESVEKTLKTSISQIMKIDKSSSKLTVAQNKSELPKTITAKALSKVAQNSTGVAKGSNKVKVAV